MKRTIAVLIVGALLVTAAVFFGTRAAIRSEDERRASERDKAQQLVVRTQLTKARLQSLTTTLKIWQYDNPSGAIPSLAVLVAEGGQNDAGIDAWGNPITMSTDPRSDGWTELVFASGGEDGQIGTGDDLTDGIMLPPRE